MGRVDRGRASIGSVNQAKSTYPKGLRVRVGTEDQFLIDRPIRVTMNLPWFFEIYGL